MISRLRGSPAYSILLVGAFLVLTLVSGLGFLGCNEQQTADISTGFSVAARSISVGITEVHGLRVAGVATPAKSLDLAHKALEVNDGLKEGVGAMLDVKEIDDAGRLSLVNLLDKEIPRAQTLADEGVIPLKNGTVKTVFTLSAYGGVESLRQLQQSLKRDIGKGLKIPISEATAAELKATADELDDNEKRLKAAIAELEGNSSPPPVSMARPRDHLPAPRMTRGRTVG
jgi:hypothetical protein